MYRRKTEIILDRYFDSDVDVIGVIIIIIIFVVIIIGFIFYNKVTAVVNFYRNR